MSKLGLIGIIFSFQMLTAIPSGFATTFANRPLGAIVKEAAFILRGKTHSSHSDWGRGANQRTIFTYTDFEVTEVLKGKISEKRILLRQPGGIKDGMELSVPGTAAFNSGDDVVVTLAPADDADRAYDVLNFTAGKYNVVVEKDETFLVNSLSAGEVYDPNRGNHDNHDNHQNPSYLSKIPLETFRQIIKGNAPDAAAQNQFKPAEKAIAPAAPPAPAGHSHASAETVTAQTPEPAEPEDNNNRVWIALSFFLFFVGLGLSLWIAIGKKRGGKKD